MSYHKILENIFTLTKHRGIHPSLATIENLCTIYNHPERAFPAIHVAGTNGKGSVCTKIATCLAKGGYRVGLYTSPHISTFRERFQLNGEMISEADASELLYDILQTLSLHKITASFFEISTLLAFLYFRKMNLDVAVIETGLGGRWDATNVIRPLLSCITSIGYDHMDLLGPTLEEIAREKAGIMKRGVPVVIGPDVPKTIMQSSADERECELYQSLFVANDYDRENLEVARLCLQLIQKSFHLSEEALQVGLQAKPPCRFEVHAREIPIVFDVAHNAHGVARLLEKLSSHYPEKRYRFVVGFSKGKDISACARAIERAATAVHVVSGSHPRLASVEEVCSAFSKVIQEPSVSLGLHNALQKAASTDVIVITGSFFIMQEARKAIGIVAPVDPCLWYDPCKIVQNSH